MARLQFRHLDKTFNTREEAILYIKALTNPNDVLSVEFERSLIGEPIVVKYYDKNDEEQLILAIGTSGDNDKEKELEDYHIIDSAEYVKGISELSGLTEDILDQIEEAMGLIDGITDRVDALESGLTETNEKLDQLDEEAVKEIEINTRFNTNLIADGFSGVVATVENNKAYMEVTTDNIPFSRNTVDEEGHELDIIHHGHTVTEFAQKVQQAFKDEEAERKGIHIVKVSDDEHPDSVLVRYKLVNKDGIAVENSDYIDVYKDSSLVEIYLGTSGDTINPQTGVITKLEGDKQFLNYAYIKANGEYDLVKVDISKFLTDQEFADGLKVDNNIVKVKIDESGEPFLTVGTDGVKLSGVQNAIDAAVTEEKTRAQGVENALIDEIDATQTGAGLAADGSYIHDHPTNYIDEATSLANADHLLDAAIKGVSDKVDDLSASTISEINNVRESMSDNYDDLLAKIEAEKARAEEAESDLGNKIANEITRATEKENQIENDLNSEISRSVEKDNELTNAINSEITRATEKETAIENSLNSETERATAKENEISDALDAEIARATARENEIESSLTDALNNEISRATEKENELQTNIDNVNDRLTAITGQEGDTYKKHNTTPEDSANYINVAKSMDDADFILDKNLGELSASTVSEIERLDTKINGVNSSLSNALQSVSEALDNEIDRATEKETELENKINTEVSNREAADNALSDRIDNLEGKTLSSENAIALEENENDTKITLKINENEKILSQNVLGLMTNISVDILKENDKDYIVLKGINDAEVSRVDATSFIKDGMLDSVRWVGESNILEFVFNTDAGKETIRIDFNQFVNDELNRQIAQLQSAVTIINGSVTTPNSTYYKIDDVLVKYGGTSDKSNGSLIRYYTDAEGHKYYVSNDAKDMVYDGTNLETTITNILNNLDTVGEDLTALKERVRIVEETLLEVRTKVVEIIENLANEIARATARENEIENNLNAEITRATNEENEIWSALTKEIADRTAADEQLRDDLDAEIARATAAETTLQNNINTEKSEREAEDVLIWSAITGMQGDIDDNYYNKSEVDQIADGLFASAEYISSGETKVIAFYNNDGTLLDSIDATEFIKDGMVESVYVSGTSLVITFNTDAGKETIEIPIDQIFDADNYYTKEEVDTLIENESTERIAEDQDIWSAITELREYSDSRDNEIEFVTGQALNNINNRIEELSATTDNHESRIEALETTPSIAYVQINDEKHYTVEGDTENYVDLGDGFVKTDDIQDLINVSTIKTKAEFENISATGTIVDTYLVKQIIDENELVTATALNDLNNRVNKNAEDITELETTVVTQIQTSIENLEQDIENNYYKKTETYNKSEIDTIADGLFASAEYISSGETKVIAFYNNDGTLLDSIDATEFIKDGMVDNVVISDGNLVITFNTDSGKESISIPLTQIFNPANYYTKTEVDNIVTGINQTINNEVTRATNAEDSISGAVNDLQAELDRTQAGAGLGTDGTYTPNSSANYINNATSLNDADVKLDAALKSVEDKVNELSGNTEDIVAEWQQTFEDAEFVISSSLNDLNDRILELSGRTADPVNSLAHYVEFNLSGEVNGSVTTDFSDNTLEINTYKTYTTAQTTTNLTLNDFLTIVSLSANATLTIANSGLPTLPTGGVKETHVIIENTSSSPITVTLSSDSRLKLTNGNNIYIAANGIGEMNAMITYNGTNYTIYIITT